MKHHPVSSPGFRRPKPVAIAALLAAGLPLLADFTASVWKFRKRIQVNESGAVVTCVLDNDVYSGARLDLHDLRVTRGAEEIPYVTSILSKQIESKDIPLDVINKSASGNAVEMTLDMGKVSRHNRVELTVDGDNFRNRVRVEASNDSRSWSIVRKEAYIFRYDADSGKISNLSIQYPDSTRRYLRIVIEGWSDLEKLRGATVQFWREVPARRSVRGSVAKPEGKFDPQTKTVTYEFSSADRAPKDQLRIEVGPGFFHRNVQVDHSEDRKAWTWTGSGALYRTQEEESFTIPLQESRYQHFRVRIYQGDDKPLDVRGVTAEGVDRKVTFPASQPGEYWLYYGNPDGSRPSYDLPMVLARSSLESAKTVQLGAQEQHAGYRAPVPPEKPWTDRNPAALYTVLGLAVAGLGVLTLRFLKQANTGGDNRDN